MSAGIDHELDHELVEIFTDARTGAAGVVAVHSTVLGPAMGGLRLRAYPAITAAVTDALRLSRAMSLKNSAAGLDLGGGKAVLFDDGGWTGPARARRMRVVGEVVERLVGRYVTAEDVGTSPRDMDEIGAVTRWVAGRPVDSGGRGDPSPATARTVFGAIRAGAREQFGAHDLCGVRVGVQGVGNVGRHLVRLLADAGADIVLCDADGRRAAAVAKETGAQVGALDGFVTADVDVLAPCAFGEAITGADVTRMRARVVAGAANNPLAHDAAAGDMADRDILYVPDFMANCGGIISVGAEVLGFTAADVERRIEEAIDRTAGILTEARSDGRTPHDVAVERAMVRMGAAAPRAMA